jgi:hypothetical protein
VTLEAVRLDMRSGERELRVVVIECRFAPLGSAMTDCAIVRVVLLNVIGIVCAFEIGLVTRPAIDGRSLKDSANVTFEAVRLNVRARQRELCVIMIKGRAVPICCVVAKRAVMRILLSEVILRSVVIFFVTGPAVHRRARVAIRVALKAVRLNVCAGQRELRRIVIERRLRPVNGRVADRAVLRILFRDVIRIFNARVVLLVTRPAIRRRALEHSANVTILTACQNVRTRQRESSRIVIEICLFPIHRIVTLSAVVREAIFKVAFSIIILFLVARPAIYRSVVEARRVAFETVGLDVRAGQRECGLIVVIECRVGPLCRRMTGLTACREEIRRVFGVFRVLVIFFVAFDTRERCARVLSADVTLLTIKSNVRAGQREIRVIVTQELCRLPRVRRVTFLTCRRERITLMPRILRRVVVGLMAIHADGRRIRESRSMACLTIVHRMTSGQRERFRVREYGLFPLCFRYGVALLTIEREVSLLVIGICRGRILFKVAPAAVDRQVYILAI